MAQVSSLMLARFTRLPRRSADTWQGGVLRMPMWVDGPDGTPYRPWGGVWVSLETGLATAARDFYTAAPWRHLSDEDLIHVEAPRVGKAFRHVTVLGRAGQTFGLGFFASPEDLDKLHASPDPEILLEGGGRWAVFFGPS